MNEHEAARPPLSHTCPVCGERYVGPLESHLCDGPPATDDLDTAATSLELFPSESHDRSAFVGQGSSRAVPFEGGVGEDARTAATFDADSKTIRRQGDSADSIATLGDDSVSASPVADAETLESSVSPAAFQKTRRDARLVAGDQTTDAGSPMDRRAPKELEGTTIGDYQLLELIASGGMGIVYKARQISLHRIVAFKTFGSMRAPSPKEIARFITEATAIAALQHPNIVPIYEVGYENNHHFFTMRLIEGGNLSDAIEKEPGRSGFRGGPREAARMVRTIARAIHSAHQHGVLHRDLKPANILLDKDGEPLVADFGLAKRLDEDSAITRSGDIIGSPSYMAPEQASGKSASVTVAADVYSLGAILFEMLTGHPPFRGPHVLETLRQVKEDEVRPPRDLVNSLPRDLDTICVKCLQKDPSRRYASADHLAADLDRWLQGQPIRARRIGTVESTMMWARRRPAPAALLALIAAIALIGFPFTVFLLGRTEAARAAEASQRRKVEVNDYFQRISLVEQNLLLNHLAPVEKLLKECAEGLRAWEWDYLNRWFRAHPFESPGIPMLGRDVAWGRDGKTLAVAYADGSVGLFERHDASAPFAPAPSLRILAHAKMGLAVIFRSDDRQLITLGGDGLIKLWDLAARPDEKGCLTEPLRVIEPPGAPPSAAALNGDGKILAVGYEDGKLTLFDADTGKSIRTISAHALNITALGFSPDGSRVASGGNEAKAKIWDVATGEELLTFSGHQAPVDGIAWDPSGRRIASASMDTTLRLWDAATGEGEILCEGHNAPIFGLAFSPDGSRVATASMDKTVKLWEPGTGREVLTLRGHTGPVFRVAYAADGRTLASVATDGAKVWNATPVDDSTRQERLTYRGHGAWTFAASFRPQGTEVGSVSGNGTVHLWNPGDGSLVRAFGGHQAPVFHLAFRPDGQVAATCDASGATLVWEVSTGQILHTLRSKEETYHVSWSPDGRRLLTSGSDGVLRLWDATTGATVREFAGHKSWVWSTDFSPDGKRIASGGFDASVGIWDTESEKPLFFLQGHKALIRSVAFHPDGKRVASAGDSTVRIWDLDARKELLSVDDHGPDMEIVTFSPDGKVMAGGSENGKILLWKTDDGTLVDTLRGHTALIHGIDFDRDGKRLISASWDDTIKLWDTSAPTK